MNKFRDFPTFNKLDLCYKTQNFYLRQPHREPGNYKTIVIRLSNIRQTKLIFVKKFKNSTYARMSCDREVRNYKKIIIRLLDIRNIWSLQLGVSLFSYSTKTILHQIKNFKLLSITLYIIFLVDIISDYLIYLTPTQTIITAKAVSII